VEQHGRFRIDGHALFIWPKEAAAPWLEELRQRREEVILYLISRYMLMLGPEGGYRRRQLQ
jgi:hypothetical protein